LRGFTSYCVGGNPALEVDVFFTDANKDLIEAGIDVALRMGELADSTLTARKIGQSQRRVIGAPAYFETIGVPQTPAAYAGSRLKLPMIREGTAWKASLPAVLGKTRRTE
jgi:LysR substrate binding domain